MALEPVQINQGTDDAGTAAVNGGVPKTLPGTAGDDMFVYRVGDGDIVIDDGLICPASTGTTSPSAPTRTGKIFSSPFRVVPRSG